MTPKKDKIKKACDTCGKDFKVHPYRVDTAKFCSRGCQIACNIKNQIGIPRSDTTKQKLREKRLGMKLSKEWKENLSKAHMGLKHSAETIKKFMGREAWNKGKEHKAICHDKNPTWRGEEATYGAKHVWVRKHLGKACGCAINSDHKGVFDWANISREYKRDFADWIPLCRQCHVTYDKTDITLLELYQGINSLRLQTN